jgi:hypothetical protein
MVWLMRFRAVALVVGLVFALGLVALAFFPGLRKTPVTWRGGAPMSRPSRFAFGGLFSCFILGELLWPYRVMSRPPAFDTIIGVFFIATFVFVAYDWLTRGSGDDREGPQEDAPSGDGAGEDRKPGALNTDLDLRYMPWFFWAGLVMGAAGGVLMVVSHAMSGATDAPATSDRYAIILGLVVFIVGTGAMILGTRDAKRRAKE